MSIKQMSRVWEKAATDDPSTLLVLLSLADWANDDGVCWPAIDSIAEKCRISSRTAQRIIHELEDCGLLEVTRKRGRSHTNTYRLKVPTCQVLFDLKGVNESPIEDEKVTNETEKVTKQALKGDTAMSPEPSEPPKPEPSIKKRADKNTTFKLPSWVPKQDWEDWLEVRKKKGAPATVRAMELNLERLAKYQNKGHPAGKVLQLAIERGWTGLFEPKEYGNANGSTTRAQEKLNRNRQAIVSGLTGQGDWTDAGHNGADVPRNRTDSGTGVVLEGSPQRAKSATNSG